jgi:hypothetical protein
MRFLLLAAVAMFAASSGAAPAKPPQAKAPDTANCQRTTSHYARDGSIYRGDRIAPKKLTELPPAIGFMAVYRTVNGCEAPMTMVEYKTGRRP